jgi:hypothetical protein
MSFSGCDHPVVQMRLVLCRRRFFVWLKQAVSSSRPGITEASRAAPVKHGRRPSPEAARSVLDRGEHVAKLGQVGCDFRQR